LKGQRANAEKHQQVDHQELVISRHDQVVQCGEGDDRVSLLGDQQQEQGNEEGENRNEEGWDEGLEQLRFPFVLVQVPFLWDFRDV